MCFALVPMVACSIWSQHSLGWNVDMATQKVPVRILYEMAFSARESFFAGPRKYCFPAKGREEVNNRRICTLIFARVWRKFANLRKRNPRFHSGTNICCTSGCSNTDPQSQHAPPRKINISFSSRKIREDGRFGRNLDQQSCIHTLIPIGR